MAADISVNSTNAASCWVVYFASACTCLSSDVETALSSGQKGGNGSLEEG